MILIIKDYFEGSSGVTKTYQEDMMGFHITNDHNTSSLTFTIHNLSISVKPLEAFKGKFAPFRSVTVNSTIPYRATVLAPFDETAPPPEPDITAPTEVTNLSANNVTATSFTLSWTASDSEDAIGYDIYKDGEFLASVSNTNVEVTGLSPSTEYTFSVMAKDAAGNISSGTSITISTLGVDTSPPVLTITQGGTFTDTQSVTMSTNEDATIYYTLDGSEPTTSSSLYTGPLTLTDTTTVKAFARDTAGNESAVQTATYTKDVAESDPGIVTDGLVLHYDFTNRTGTTSNTITDTVNNVPATLVGVTHDGSTDGYVDNKGLLLQVQDYVQIPTNTSPLSQLINLNSGNGLTIQMISYDTNGTHWTTDGNELTSTNSGGSVLYRKNDGSTGRMGAGTYWVIDSSGYKQSYNDAVNPIGSEATNTFTFRLNSNNTLNVFINDSIGETQNPVPNDFKEFINTLAKSPLYLRKNVLQNSHPEKLVAFMIYNRELTDEEIRNTYRYFRNKDPLEGISVNPSNVQLNRGEKQRLSVRGLPNLYTELLDISYQSGNEGYVTVDKSGILTGVNDGETTVSVTATLGDQTFMDYINVKIGGLITAPPSSTRVINGMSINRKMDSIKVGENFVVMATALSSDLPYDIYNDNIVIWESSNPDVARVQYGVLEGVSSGTATLTAYDATKTYSSSFDINVVNHMETQLKDADIYYVNVSIYSIKINNTDSTNTTNGIQNALNYASTNGYKKIVFPYGTYLISPAVRTIFPPSDMIIDFSNSIINIEPSPLTSTGYKMFYFTNVKNTKLMRAHVYGERDSTTIQNSVENCLSVLIDDCLNSGFESCTFSKSPGFNVITGTLRNKNMGKNTQSISVSRFNFELGNIDENGQNDNRITKNYYRYNQYMNVSGLGEYYLLGYTQGYHGYPHLRSRLYSIHFYDQNYNHIESQMYNLQYYNYPKPPNAKYAKIVIYQEAPPSSGDTDFNGAVAFIRTIGMPRNCYIKNCTLEDNFSTGLAMCGGQGWTIEGNMFSNNRGRMPGCDIDWEDGWEHMVGDVLKKNTFNSRLGVIFSAGGSLAAFDNTFNQSTMTVWSRTQNFRIFNNEFNSKGGFTNDFKTQGDSVLARNIFTDGANYSTGINHTGANYKVHNIYNTVV
ncbi:chitobiase/beta-hexosaminidase C-terminal domain-containing protein [Niallia oryzisoli]|uniref:Chitobiase/beta-hexosaminidase C-terminal domain-containing protein n=1 Tax=Niallia oryzisoli TaxID=1737571 RepID=A0ABZ2CAV1_9BACI